MSKITMNVAIDGPAGAGKSTIAKAAAAQLGYIYVDTGAIYRSVALYCIENGISSEDMEGVEKVLADIKPELKYIDGAQHVFVNGEDVSGRIRTPEVSMATSKIAAIPAVRKFLFDIQRSIAAENDVIMDGRDIGTVVLPDAQLKIYLTASAESRARRRYDELIAKGEQVTFEAVLEDVKQRDYNDMNRETAPLKQADDAVLVDTTGLDLAQSIEAVMTLIKNTDKGQCEN